MGEQQIKLKLKGERDSGSRKLLVGLFLLTGIISFGLWWRGKAIHNGESGWEELTQELSYKVSPKPTQISPSPAVDSKQAELVTRLEKLIASASGEYAFCGQRTDGTKGYGFNQTVQMPAASIMKVPVFIAVEGLVGSGKLKLDDQYVLEEADRSSGSGPLQFKPAGTKYTVDQLLTYLGKNSDNTAWVMFNRRLGKKTMEEAMRKIGMNNSSYNNLTITAEDAAKMFLYINGKDFFTGYLTGSIYEDRIPVGVPEGITVIHKVGTDAGVWADAGIIMCAKENTKCTLKPYVLVILNKGVVRDEAVKLVPEITKIVFNYENSLLH